MAYTEQDRDRLRAAIASGVLTVAHEGGSITYRSMNELQRALARVETEIASAAGVVRVRRVVLTGRSGF